jgi:N utilization substance protein A
MLALRTAVELEALDHSTPDPGNVEEHCQRGGNSDRVVLAERDAKRKELGVSDDLAKIHGVTTAMLVAFGENEIKTLEDLAGAETDDLSGWTERKKEKDAEPVRHKGVLEGFEMSRKDVEDMIMAARIAAGWVTQEDLDKMRAEQVAAAAAAEAAKAAAAAAPADAKA